ncbi:unnamed protein product, partial [Laminaria digitata]
EPPVDDVIRAREQHVSSKLIGAHHRGVTWKKVEEADLNTQSKQTNKHAMYGPTYGTAENHAAQPLSSTNSTTNSSSRHGSGRNSMESSLHSRAGPPPREYRKTARGQRQRETIGVMHVPGRILATLQRKFW